MRKNKNVVSANFRRESSSSSCIEVFLDGSSLSIDIWAGNIEYCAKSLGEKEIEEVISILSCTKDEMLKQRNFPQIYEEMLLELMEVQGARYGVKEEGGRVGPWRCTDISVIEKMLTRNFNIKDVHILSSDINCNSDEAGWTYLTLSLKFRDGKRR